MLMPQTALRKACEVAERIRFAIAERALQPLPGVELPVTISIGVAMLPGEVGGDEAEVARKLVASADAALYRAKDQGRNRVVSCSRLRSRPG